MAVQFRKLLNDETGATAIEYGFLALFIALAGVTAFTLVGSSVATSMNNVVAKM